MTRSSPLQLLVALAIDPVRAHDRLIDHSSPVVTLGVPPLQVTYLLGADANRFVFANPGLFQVKDAYRSLSVVSGETPLLRSDGPDHQRRRRWVAPAFSAERVDAYRDLMARSAHRVIDTWTPGERVDLSTAFRTAIRRNTIEALFGTRLGALEADLGRDLQPGLDLADNDPVRFEIRRRLTTPAWRRAAAGRARVVEVVRAEINARQHRDVQSRDLLGAMLDGRAADGCRLSEREIIDQVISLIAAGYETTSGAFGWACHALLIEPGAGAHRSEHVVAETLRLYPPAVVTARTAAETFTYAGNEIPAGRLVLISPYVTHRSPGTWREPLRFDPSRWDSSLPGFCRPPPHEYLPFGGGSHRCVGARLASMQLVTMLDALRDRADLRSVAARMPRPVNIAALRPYGGVPAEVRTVQPPAGRATRRAGGSSPR